MTEIQLKRTLNRQISCPFITDKFYVISGIKSNYSFFSLGRTTGQETDKTFVAFPRERYHDAKIDVGKMTGCHIANLPSPK